MSNSKNISYAEIFGNLADNLIYEIKPVGCAEYKDEVVSVLATGDGVATNSFFANGNMVRITAYIEGDIESVNIWLVITKDDDTEELYKILDGAKPGSFELTFDAANYIVYSNAKKFRVVIDTASPKGSFKIKRFEVSELKGIQQSGYYDEKFECMMKNIMDSLDLLHSASLTKTPTLVSANGVRYTLGVDGKGDLYTTPNIPSKIVFIGNSLTFGMGDYGMCASGPCKDYFYYVQKAILEKNPAAKFSKIYGSKFEMSENEDYFEEWWSKEINAPTAKTVKNSFAPDTDLVIIQLSDNVNTPARAKGMECNIEKLIFNIKSIIPKARIIWVLGWFNRANSYAIISAACAKWNIPIVDISDLNIKENQAYSGQKYILKDGSLGVVKDGWITHPGDKGMYIIAERVIKAIDM